MIGPVETALKAALLVEKANAMPPAHAVLTGVEKLNAGRLKSGLEFGKGAAARV